MSRGRNGRMTLIGIATVFAVSGCSDQAGPGPLTPVEPSAATYGHTLIECPVSEESFATATLGARGGSLRVKGHELSLPLNAVLTQTKFELRERVSNYMEIRIRANDQAEFEFRTPVTITIDYSRCTRSNIEKDPLTVWKIDPQTKQLLQHMGGVDDKAARTVMFETDGLSTFSIAR